MVSVRIKEIYNPNEDPLNEAVGDVGPIDAQKVAKALLITARQQVSDQRFPVQMAKQMADVLNTRIKQFIDEYDKESTWTG